MITPFYSIRNYLSLTFNLSLRRRRKRKCYVLVFLADFFEQDISDAGPADLYFKEPYELINVFRSIEMQNLNALIHLESLAEPMAQMMTTIQNAEQQIKLEIGEITNTINELRVM